jgi:DNA polymerase-3 subunit gamma/tau
LDTVVALAEFSPDWGHVLDALAEVLHRVQVKQLVPGTMVAVENVDVEGLASGIRPEVVQLWYQIAINGARDLELAPSARVGFEMCLLRMLAFRPTEDKAAVAAGASPAQAMDTTLHAKSSMPAVQSEAMQKPVAVDPVSTPIESRSPEPAAHDTATVSVRGIADTEEWLQLVNACHLRGPARELAAHAAFVAYDDGKLRLALASGFDYLSSSRRSIEELAAALAPLLGMTPSIRFEVATAAAETLNQRLGRERDARQVAAEETFRNDPDVQRLIQQHGARLVPDSIRPFDE